MAFFADRLKIYLRERGARHDLIDAVFALPDQDDLLVDRAPRRGARRLSRYRRRRQSARGLSPRREYSARRRKEDGAGAFEGAVDHSLLQEPAEVVLWEKIEGLDIEVRRHLELAQARVVRPEFADETPFEDAMKALVVSCARRSICSSKKSR